MCMYVYELNMWTGTVSLSTVYYYYFYYLFGGLKSCLVLFFCLCFFWGGGQANLKCILHLLPQLPGDCRVTLQRCSLPPDRLFFVFVFLTFEMCKNLFCIFFVCL